MNTNSEILRMIGISDLNIDIIFIIMGVMLLLLIFFMVMSIVQNKKIKKITKRMEKFMSGKEGKSLEEEISQIINDNKYLRENSKKNEQDIKNLYNKIKAAFQKMGIVKYDAFNQMGGQLSYSIALLDEDNNGFIINTVHGDEGSYSYTKEIKTGQCEISLGKEEQEALELAMEK